MLKSMLQVFPLGVAPAAVVIGLQTFASQELCQTLQVLIFPRVNWVFQTFHCKQYLRNSGNVIEQSPNKIITETARYLHISSHAFSSFTARDQLLQIYNNQQSRWHLCIVRNIYRICDMNIQNIQDYTKTIRRLTKAT